MGGKANRYEEKRGRMSEPNQRSVATNCIFAVGYARRDQHCGVFVEPREGIALLGDLRATSLPRSRPACVPRRLQLREW